MGWEGYNVRGAAAPFSRDRDAPRRDGSRPFPRTRRSRQWAYGRPDEERPPPWSSRARCKAVQPRCIGRSAARAHTQFTYGPACYLPRHYLPRHGEAHRINRPQQPEGLAAVPPLEQRRGKELLAFLDSALEAAARPALARIAQRGLGERSDLATPAIRGVGRCGAGRGRGGARGGGARGGWFARGRRGGRVRDTHLRAE